MNCPICHVDLIESEYEGQAILKCVSCNGILLEETKVRIIQNKLDSTDKELITEYKKEKSADNKTVIECSKCGVNMKKVSALKGKSENMRGQVNDFKVDRCGKCKVIWLDGGELSKIQLDYQLSETGIDRVYEDNIEKEENIEEQENHVANSAAIPSFLNEDYDTHPFDCRECQYPFRSKESPEVTCEICGCKMSINSFKFLNVLKQSLYSGVHRLLGNAVLFATIIFIFTVGLAELHYGQGHLIYYFFIIVTLMLFSGLSYKANYINLFDQFYYYKNKDTEFNIVIGFCLTVSLLLSINLILGLFGFIQPFMVLDYIMPIIWLLSELDA
jgi:Zn-finger nucleic acid-binding protein